MGHKLFHIHHFHFDFWIFVAKQNANVQDKFGFLCMGDEKFLTYLAAGRSGKIAIQAPIQFYIFRIKRWDTMQLYIKVLFKDFRSGNRY
jgi:hypothetical protein